MIYVDTSVALAYLFNEPAAPPDAFWGQTLVSSELLEYELRVRANARSLAHEPVDALMSRLAIVPLQHAVLTRALSPFAMPVRTLDAMHLATIEFLRENRQTVSLASFDRRMCDAALSLGVALHPLGMK